MVILENPDVDKNNKPHWSVRFYELENNALKAAYVIVKFMRLQVVLNARD